MKINFKEIFFIPNLISLFRLLLAIPFIIILNLAWQDSSYFAYTIILIFVAFISDIIDGFVARRTNKISELGKLLDPIADKILVSIIVIYLFLMNKVPSFYFYTIVLRDLTIFFGGIFVSSKIDRVLPSNLLGKAAVFSIGIFFITIMLNVPTNSEVYLGLMYLSVALSILSILGYAIRAFEFMSKRRK